MNEPKKQTIKKSHHLPMVERSRKLLVVVDETPESKVAIRFAAGRASHISGGGIILFHCVRPGDFQHWITVADHMRDEAIENARVLLSDVAERIYTYCGVEPEIVIETGEPGETLKTFMEQRQDLFGLVLGANADGDPGPLVDYFSGPLVGSLTVPVMIIPGGMTFEQVDSMV